MSALNSSTSKYKYCFIYKVGENTIAVVKLV